MNNIKKKMRIMVPIIASAILSYPFTLGILTSVSRALSPKIHNIFQLENMLGEEREKLDIPNEVKIECKFGADEYGFAREVAKDSYEINLGKNVESHYANLSALRHELFHIAEGHAEGQRGDRKQTAKEFLQYLFFHEPSAIIYELSSLR